MILFIYVSCCYGFTLAEISWFRLRFEGIKHGFGQFRFFDCHQNQLRTSSDNVHARC